MARDRFIDGRVFVNRKGNDGRGHLGLGNAVSITDLINDVVIPNTPSLSVLPYIFQNGITEVVGTPSRVGLGGTLLNDTLINGQYELEWNLDAIVNRTTDYNTETEFYNTTVTGIYTVSNTCYSPDCPLSFEFGSSKSLPVTINGGIGTNIDGSKYAIESRLSNIFVSSGYYNFIGDDCIPYSLMEQSYYEPNTGANSIASLTLNGSINLLYKNYDIANAISSSINMEGSISMQTNDAGLGLSQSIILPSNAAARFIGINSVTSLNYNYEFPDTTPNNGDIMVAGLSNKLQYVPLETQIQATTVITGVVGQKTYFHLPFIENHKCTRINYVSTSTLAGNIAVNIVDEHTGGTVDSVTLVVSNSISNWGGHTPLNSPLPVVGINRLWSVQIISNTQLIPATALYLTLTFTPEFI